MESRSESVLLDRLREEVASQCREIATDGSTVGGAGNVSVRVDDQVLVTRAGLRFDRANADDICVVGLDGELMAGGRPSSETGLHLGIYARSRAGAVVHTHGQSSVAVGLVLDEVPLVHYNVLRLGGHIPTVPYYLFGSPELAEATGAAVASGARAVLLRNHGSVSCATTLVEAIENAQMIEWICQVYLAAKTLGEPSLLTDADLEAVAQQAARLSYGHD